MLLFETTPLESSISDHRILGVLRREKTNKKHHTGVPKFHTYVNSSDNRFICYEMRPEMTVLLRLNKKWAASLGSRPNESSREADQSAAAGGAV